ncbi:MAG: alpha-galactosidase [Clostridia bacterium]|nr:alpha-galactosidase [Clostridia bacterium]
MIEHINKKEKFEPLSVSDGIEIYKLPYSGKYKWIEELRGVFSTWTPLGGRDHSIRQWWFPNASSSVYQCGSPLISTMDQEGINRVTVALSDTFSRSTLTVSVDDLNQRDEMIFTVETQGEGALLRVDRRPVYYCDAISEAGEWMRSFLPDGQIPVPDNAELPLYSSWYNFHQEPEQYLLEKELELAAKIGFKTFILDDGWQFEGENTGAYQKCGEWKLAKDKFPDFKGFCDRVHGFGIKILMWFAVPFVGYDSPEYDRLKDKFAFDHPAFGAGVLDIRYPDIRRHIMDILMRYVKDYGVDGFKLDFIDAFNMDADHIPPYNDEMDVRTLDGAAVLLMDEIYATMTDIDKDFLFEFRQNYIGASIVNRCNMLRVGDCAADPVTNRVGITALRLVNGGTAIHSDMLLWGKCESTLNCQRQLLNIMFSVPQISVRLTEIPKEQFELVRRFVKYWTDNRDVLLHGRFTAYHPESNYTVITAETDEKKITVLHCEPLFTPAGKREDVLNDTAYDYIVPSTEDEFGYEIFDLYGNVTEAGVYGGQRRLNVPRGGMLKITV